MVYDSELQEQEHKLIVTIVMMVLHDKDIRMTGVCWRYEIPDAKSVEINSDKTQHMRNHNVP